MLDFREFRRAYKDNQSLSLDCLQALVQCGDYDQAFKYFLYIADQINLNKKRLAPEYSRIIDSLLDILSQSITPSRLPKSRRLILFSRQPSKLVYRIICNIDRQFFDPVLVLMNKSNEAKTLKRDLRPYHIPCRLEDNHTSIETQLLELQKIIENEQAGTIIFHGNTADIDFKIINNLYIKNTISCHEFDPLDNKRQITLNTFVPGFWNKNLEIPSFRKISTFPCWNYDTIPKAILDYANNGNPVCLLTDKPLQLFEGLDDDTIKQISFCSSSHEIDLLMKNCREVITLSENLEPSITLARKHGCDLRNLTTGRKLLYESIVDQYNSGRKLKVKINELCQKKTALRKKIPRLLLFEHNHSVPIIQSISNDIYSALLNLGADVMRIDISHFEQAQHQKDFQKLESLRNDTLARIKSFKPDQALGYNAFGIFPSGSSHLLEKLGIPYNGLFFDNPFYSRVLTKNCLNKEMVRIFCLDNSLIPLLKEGGFKQSHYFPIATSAQRCSFKFNQQTSETDLLFTATVKPHRSLQDVVSYCPSIEDKDFVNFAYPQILNGHVDLHQLLNSYHQIQGKTTYPQSFDSFFDTWFHMDIQGSSKLRLKLIETLKDFNMAIYGGNNWEKIKLNPKHEYKGYLNYNLLPSASRKAKLTLCSTPVNIIDGIQQRILDCGAMQSGILSDYRPILEHHFKLDEELYTYQSFEELKDKTEFLLKNNAAKEKAIKALHSKVIKEHTWEVRMNQFLNMI